MKISKCKESPVSVGLSFVGNKTELHGNIKTMEEKVTGLELEAWKERWYNPGPSLQIET